MRKFCIFLCIAVVFTAAGCSGSNPYSIRCVDSVFTDTDIYLLYRSEEGFADLPVPPSPGEGISFAGWYRNGDLSTDPVTQVPRGTVGNLLLVAAWSLETVYTDEAGNVLEKTATLYGQPYDPPEPPAVEGMTFLGWTEEEALHAAGRKPMTFVARYGAEKGEAPAFVPTLTVEKGDFLLTDPAPTLTFTLRAPKDTKKVVLWNVSPNTAYRYLAKENPAQLSRLLETAPETVLTYWDSASFLPSSAVHMETKTASLWQLSHSFGSRQVFLVLAECICSDGSRVTCTAETAVLFPQITAADLPRLLQQGLATGQPVYFLAAAGEREGLEAWGSLLPPTYSGEETAYWQQPSPLVGYGFGDYLREEVLVLKTTPDDTPLDRETDPYRLNQQPIPEDTLLGVLAMPQNPLQQALACAGEGIQPPEDSETAALLTSAAGLLETIPPDADKTAAVFSLLTDLQKHAKGSGGDDALSLLSGRTVGRKGAAETLWLLLNLSGQPCILTAGQLLEGGGRESLVADFPLCVLVTEEGLQLAEALYRPGEAQPGLLTAEQAATRYSWWDTAHGGPEISG